MKEEQERTPLRTILQNFLNHVENLDRLSDDSYDKEFQSLKLFSENLKSIKQYSCTEGEKEVNKKKNRYKDILPFDYTRVILSGVSGVQGSDYVNANFIKGASGSLAYIASQGPLPHTANDFWRMVVECEVQVIVMACNEEESGKHKCENYWAEREGEERHFGLASIRLVKASVVCPDFLVRTMQLKYKKNDAMIERTVCQFHYSAWPDHGVPPLVRPLLDMVRLVRDTQASETLPVLIHCSAGCGRTGTICAIDYVWGLLRAGKLTKDFSLLRLVRDMRKQRIAMVQTKDQYVLVHKAVRELFQEQLKMIDAHPYENVDLNGLPLVKEEPLYEHVGVVAITAQDEKQDNKEKDSISRSSTLVKPYESCIPHTVDKVLVSLTKTPPLPHKKKRTHIVSSKQEKEVENQTQKQKLGISAWTPRAEISKCEIDSEDVKNVAYSSTAADSGLSASSSTDSSSTITCERLPKRCPMPSSSAESVGSSALGHTTVAISVPVPQRQESSCSSVSSTPSISSLLHKPRIAKLKALFERNSVSKSAKTHPAKPFDEPDTSVIETPKARSSQQVTRSHSLGAVRKPHKFSQFQSEISETPVALYRKFFSTKDSKESNPLLKKGNQTESHKAPIESSVASSSSSNSSNTQNDFTKRGKKIGEQSLVNSKGPVENVGIVSVQYSAESSSQNLYQPTPHIHDRKPALPVKRSKSLKVVGNVDRTHFSTAKNYSVLPSQLKEKKPEFQQQLSALIGEEFSAQCQASDVSLPAVEGVYSDLYRNDLQVKPTPRERSRRPLGDSPGQDCVSVEPPPPPHGLQPTSKRQAARLSSMPQDFSHLNGSAHPVPRPREHSSYSQAKYQRTNPAAMHSESSHQTVRSKEYVNISEMKSNWHQAGLDGSVVPTNASVNSSKNWPTQASQVQTTKAGSSAQYSFDDTKRAGLQKNADQKIRRSLDDDTQRMVEDCRSFLMLSQDPGLSVCSPHLQDSIGDDMLPAEQFQSLSIEAQRKINTIVGGLGIRERRNSFRRAVCRDDRSSKPLSPKRTVKDYEPIWIQKERQSVSIGNLQVQNQSVPVNSSSSDQSYNQVRSNDICRDRIPGLPYIRQENPLRVDGFHMQSTTASSTMQSSSSLSSSSASSSSGGGKRLMEFEGAKPKMSSSNQSLSPAYHMLPSSWDQSTASKQDIHRTQQQHLQQMAQAKAKGTSRPIDPRMHANNSRNPGSMPVSMIKADAVHNNSNSPLFRRESSNIETHAISQQRAGMSAAGSLAPGPLAPPRTKRHSMGQAPQRNSMIEQSDIARASDGSKDPIYANSTSSKMVRDAWHGAPGVDVDSVAASIKQTTARSEHAAAAAVTESSTSLTRAFEKLHTKASNFRTKLSPRSDVDGSSSGSDSKQQSGMNSHKVSKSPPLSSAPPGSNSSGGSEGGQATPPPAAQSLKKQQQYL